MVKYIIIDNDKIDKGIAGEGIIVYKKDGIMNIIEKDGLSHMSFKMIGGKGHVKPQPKSIINVNRKYGKIKGVKNDRNK